MGRVERMVRVKGMVGVEGIDVCGWSRGVCCVGAMRRGEGCVCCIEERAGCDGWC